MNVLWPARGVYLVLLCLTVETGFAQVISSVQSGDWYSPATWSGGIVPTATNSSTVIIDHSIVISPGIPVSHMQVIVRANLTVSAGGTFTLMAGSMQMQGSGALLVYGLFVFSDGAAMSGNTFSNTRFFDGSEFRYASHSITDIPLATWDVASTIHVNNILGNASITLSSWIQQFGNFIYDCPAQGAFMDFNGRIRDVRGNLIIRNTNKNILRFARGHVLNLNVGKDLVIEGPSEVWFGETGENLLVNIGGSFRFRSTSTAASYLSLSGTIRVHIEGDFEIDSSYKLKCTSSSGKSAVINLKGDLYFLRGTIDALGSGLATVQFVGGVKQLFTRRAGTLFDGNIHFVVENSSTLDLGSSCLTNTNGGSLLVKGTLQLGSLHPDGVIQNNESGNFWFTGEVRFEDGAILELNGSGPQYISLMIPASNAHLIINNPYGVSCSNAIAVGSLVVRSGILHHGNNMIALKGDLALEAGAELSGDGELIFDGEGPQKIDAKNNAVRNLTIAGSPHTVALESPLRLTGVMKFTEAEGELLSNGYLIVASPSSGGTDAGSIAPLSSQHRISGLVTVERFIDPGRMYRYISSPLRDATVEDLQAFVPVTGTFNDPSVGDGMISTNPSLFYYHEQNATWVAYPVTGNARDHLLEPGKGYAAFVRSQSEPVVIKWQGVINSGPLNFAVTYTDSASGWNLVGNPYPSPVSWDNPGWTKENISNAIAVRDNRSGTFHFWNGSVGSLTNGVISTGQAFWVLATAEDPRLEITEDAKTSASAPFYRKMSPDFIQLSFTDGINNDNAFVQIDRRSKETFDRFDALKLANDHLDIAILSTDGKRLAISALPDASCEIKVPLYLSNDQSTWNGVLTVTGSQNMEGATYRLVNEKNGTVLEPSDNAFRIAFDAPESDEWMLDIRFTKPPEPQLLYDPQPCATVPAPISVSNVTPGVRYTLWQIFSQGPSQVIAEGDHFSLPYSNLTRSDSFQIQASNFCGASNASFRLSAKSVSPPRVEEGRRCGPGNVMLFAAGAVENQQYHWYNASGEEMGIGNAFHTGEIAESTKFFVAVYDSASHCFSERTSVYAHIEKNEPVTLALRGDTLHIHGSPGELTWYFNGKVIENLNTWYLPRENGEYKVTATNGSCVSTDSVMILRPKNLKNEVTVYPNPATALVTFACDDGDDVILNDIINSNGISVFYLCPLNCTDTCCNLDIRSLVNGTYLLLFRSGDKHKPIRLSVAK